MVQLLLAILGIFYFLRRRKLKRLAAADFGLQYGGFDEWQRLELRSIDIFLMATWGLILLSCPLGFLIGAIIVASGVEADGSEGLIAQGVYLALFLIGLFVSAAYGSKAAQHREALGIPRKWWKV